MIQKIYTHFKKTAGDHKLGVLYVVDSVTRKWLERAKSSGQDVDGSATDGTFAAGVHRVTELMPVLMNDIVQSAPENHKVSRSSVFGGPEAYQQIVRRIASLTVGDWFIQRSLPLNDAEAAALLSLDLP